MNSPRVFADKASAWDNPFGSYNVLCVRAGGLKKRYLWCANCRKMFIFANQNNEKNGRKKQCICV